MAIAGLTAFGASASEESEGRYEGPVPAVRASEQIRTLTVSGRGAAKAPTEAELTDLATAAKSSGDDLGELIRTHEDVVDFSVLATEIEQKYPEFYVRSGLTDADSKARYWISFTERPPAAIEETLSRLSVDVELRYGLPASAVEISRVQSLMTQTVFAHKDLFSGVEAEYDADRNTLVFTYIPALEVLGTSKEVDLDKILNDALWAGAGASKDGLLPVPVELNESQDVPGELQVQVRGGRTLKLNDAGECTAGFTAVRNGDRGVLTAEHCPNGLDYQDGNDVISEDPVIADNTSSGANIDMQWHRTLGNHGTEKYFRASGFDTSDDRAVEAVANAPIDSVICKWGFVGHYDCAYLAAQDICRDNTCGLDRADDGITMGGDSGGPWFYANTARGIHTGTLSTGFSVFTRIGRVQGSLNAEVLKF